VAQLHPLVAGFSADVYDRGRPAYGPEVTGVLAAELGLEAGARVLDLGAGTGKLSGALVDAGFDVVAVEPLDDMRAVLAEKIGPERSLAGTAEAIPLPDDSVDAVTMADSFHWFDEQPAIEEIRRVLRPGGGAAVLWTAPGWHGDGFEWAHELGEMVAKMRADHPMASYGSRGAVEPFAEAGGFAPVRSVGVDAARESDREAILSYVASWSWVGSLPETERSQVLEQADALLRRHGVTRLRHAIHTELFLTQLL
jgi:SAM-dependent methyltransferase